MFYSFMTFFEFSSSSNSMQVEELDEIHLEEPISQFSDTKPRDKSIPSLTSDNKIHRCEKCGITCCTAVILERHRKSHLQKKPFACAECKKQFRTRVNMEVHLRSHTNERPFVCEVRNIIYLSIFEVYNFI